MTAENVSMESARAADVVRLDKSQIDDASAVLARAFQHDLLTAYMVPEPEQRLHALVKHFSAFLRLGHLFGEVHTTRGTLQGAAVWFAPGWDPKPERLEQAGVTLLEHELPEGAFVRFLTVTDHMGRLHEREVRVPHWYLALLGVDVGLQGKGVGGALLAPVLRRADEQRLPCYLETVEAKNLPFYRTHGFEVLVEGVEPKSDIRFWTMLRPHRRADAPTGERSGSRR